MCTYDCAMLTHMDRCQNSGGGLGLPPTKDATNDTGRDTPAGNRTASAVTDSTMMLQQQVEAIGHEN